MKSGFRERFMFWLDLNKPEEYQIAEIVFELKQQRSFAQTVRDGIRLIVSLRAGKLDVLFELFPWIQHTLIAHAPVESKANTEFRQLLALKATEAQSAFVEAAPADPAESRNNFAAGMGNLFDDDEDLWD